MRRLSSLLLVVVLVVAGAQMALAAPSVTGYLEQNITYEFGSNTPYTFGTTLYRLNVSGSVSDNLSYYGRLQGKSNGGPTVTLAYLTYKNLGVQGLDVGIGRQSRWWSRLNAGGSAFGVGSFDGITVGISGAPAALHGYYKVNSPDTAQKLASDEEVGAHVGYSTELSGFALALDGVLRNQLQTNGKSAYGVSASLGVKPFGDVYFEATKGFTATEFDEVHVGANIALLEEPAGISAWAEYGVKSKEFNFELSRDIVSGLTAKFGGTKSGNAWSFTTTLTASASF